jgi:hypothetical protein
MQTITTIGLDISPSRSFKRTELMSPPLKQVLPNRPQEASAER